MAIDTAAANPESRAALLDLQAARLPAATQASALV
jgi:hypothetical protein